MSGDSIPYEGSLRPDRRVPPQRDGRRMRWAPPGSFWMGSDDFYPEEKPVRRVEVAGFWMDECPVTNDEFALFVAETGYVTFAERAPTAMQYPGAPADLLRAGSFVFLPPAGAEAARDKSSNPSWWRYVFGASWRHPLGPESDLDGLGAHPVVHVVSEDAEAYASWAGKALPTEAEWEYAARGGRDDRSPFAWGFELKHDGLPMAKVWEGSFPHLNRAPPGLERTAPVRSYPANGFGIFDLIGNVWEWTSDWFAMPTPDPGGACCGGARGDDAKRRESAAAEGGIPRRVLKGGSHLCSPDYCFRYRPAARWPQPIDTSTSHTGFRCVVRDALPPPQHDLS